MHMKHYHWYHNFNKSTIFCTSKQTLCVKPRQSDPLPLDDSNLRAWTLKKGHVTHIVELTQPKLLIKKIVEFLKRKALRKPLFIAEKDDEFYEGVVQTCELRDDDNLTPIQGDVLVLDKFGREYNQIYPYVSNNFMSLWFVSDLWKWNDGQMI